MPKWRATFHFCKPCLQTLCFTGIKAVLKNFLEIQTSHAKILRQEIGSLPIDNLSLGFFLRVNVELVKDHNALVLQVIERPIVRLAIRRNIST